MSNVIQAAFVVDGKIFTSKEEAQVYIRRPKILAALNAVTGGNTELNEWLVENQERVEIAFESGTIKRVTKSESKKLADALDHIASVLADDKKAQFVVENIGAIKDSFRWPSVKRMSEEEKATAARNTLVAASEGNEELAQWIIENKTAILEAFQAGVEKRQVNPAAAEALAAYRAKKAAEKAAAAQATETAAE